MKELNTIQSKLTAPKEQFNKFGNYKYRSCEDILKAVKPLLAETKCTLMLQDEVLLIGNRYYIKATATLTNSTGESVATTALAREDENKKGMDGSQITGASSSYARKYALNGLFAIDDTKDADATNTHGKDDANANTDELTPHEIIENEIKPALAQANTREEVLKIYEAYKKLENEPGYKTAFSARRKALGF
ncbi:MAG: ERF family protein [Bacteroidaceae bacterium]|nr:ERF family protein [Bacteroidaceae bacterium]